MKAASENIERELSLEEAVQGVEKFFLRRDEKELYRFVLESVEKPLIESVLSRTRGNQLRAARLLGINRNTLRSKIRKLGIQPGKWKRY